MRLFFDSWAPFVSLGLSLFSLTVFVARGEVGWACFSMLNIIALFVVHAADMYARRR